MNTYFGHYVLKIIKFKFKLLKFSLNCRIKESVLQETNKKKITHSFWSNYNQYINCVTT